MPHGHAGSHDKQEHKAGSLGFRGLVLKYWHWQQLYHIKFYDYMCGSGSVKSSS
jgi:hypothetical protein